MALQSTMLELGTVAPDFDLPDVRSGEHVRRSDFTGHPLFVAFICRHCPYVKHVESRLAELGNAARGEGVGVVAISANDVQGYPDDAPDRLAEQAERVGFEFPYLYDESQQVARAYTAACTPDFFLFDGDHALVWRGRMDGSSPGNDVPVTGRDLEAALRAVLDGTEVPTDQLPSIGCGIKWKPLAGAR